ncbi:unnamed protein product [Durusdinium trenchii]|uniref:RanBD1 domain-containing protein n=1 Tax=Durusdinium trenchii TaxID=1381693 RepID=A0ABP0KUU7_9DINO
MKRPASELERVSQTEPELAGDAGDAGCESNPFAGISLFQSGASSLVSSTTGFPSNGTMTESGNPFMGLSLFSSPTSGKLFTAAVTTLQQKPPGDAGDQPKADCEAAEVAEAAEDAANEADDGESAGDEPTGEEDEEVIFRADCKLWKLVKLEDGKAEGWRWQERGCGIVHINRHKTSGAGRLVMRMRGVLKLLLNTPIFPTTRYEKVGQKSVRFVGVDTEESQSCHGEGTTWCCEGPEQEVGRCRTATATATTTTTMKMTATWKIQLLLLLPLLLVASSGARASPAIYDIQDTYTLQSTNIERKDLVQKGVARPGRVKYAGRFQVCRVIGFGVWVCCFASSPGSQGK